MARTPRAVVYAPAVALRVAVKSKPRRPSESHNHSFAAIGPILFTPENIPDHTDKRQGNAQ